jgi:penicillin-binding protein 1A
MVMRSLIMHGLIGFVFVLGACGAGMLAFIGTTKNLIDFSLLECYSPHKPTILLDDEGNEWARFTLDRREPVTIDKMPSHLIQAFLAAEDHTFFTHPGISWRGIIRSLLVNLYHCKKVQGASTITQQLVRLLFFDTKKTFSRKIKEQWYSLLVERDFTKEQILQTYLNYVYFGMDIYGAQAASQRFWGIPVQQLSIAQAATLAAIVRSPLRYCPLRNQVLAVRRRNIVLRSMERLGYITADQAHKARKSPLALLEQETSALAPHFREMIRQHLEQTLGRSALYRCGLVVQTTLNQALQRQAQKVFTEHVALLKKSINPAIDGGLIALEVKTGAIKALVGGYDFKTSKFNRAVQAHRQLGSILKPLIYAAALEQGKTFADTYLDEPFSLMQHNKMWTPSNYNSQFEGQMTLAYALSHSNNIVAIKTLLDVGCQRVAYLGQRCKLGALQPYPSLALGCIDVTLKDAVGFFNIFSNAGVYVEPYGIAWIKDGLGNKIIKNKETTEIIVPAKVSDQVAKVLSLGMERMRMNKLAHEWIDSQALGKTGTTNDCRTCWFAGSTPSLTTAVYIGCDDNRSLGKNIYPSKTAFPIWLGVHKQYHDPKKKFMYDPSLREITINVFTGQLLTPEQRTVEQYTILI